jgi:hypothetical protein
MFLTYGIFLDINHPHRQPPTANRQPLTVNNKSYDQKPPPHRLAESD